MLSFEHQGLRSPRSGGLPSGPGSCTVPRDGGGGARWFQLARAGPGALVLVADGQQPLLPAVGGQPGIPSLAAADVPASTLPGLRVAPLSPSAPRGRPPGVGGVVRTSARRGRILWCG